MEVELDMLLDAEEERQSRRQSDQETDIQTAILRAGDATKDGYPDSDENSNEDIRSQYTHTDPRETLVGSKEHSVHPSQAELSQMVYSAVNPASLPHPKEILEQDAVATMKAEDLADQLAAALRADHLIITATFWERVVILIKSTPLSWLRPSEKKTGGEIGEALYMIGRAINVARATPESPLLFGRDQANHLDKVPLLPDLQASYTVATIQRLISLDPAHTTSKDMDDRGWRFVCMDCDDRARRVSGQRPRWTWRDLVQHCLSGHRQTGEEGRWRLLIDAEVDYVKMHPLGTVEEASLGRCSCMSVVTAVDAVDLDVVFYLTTQKDVATGLLVKRTTLTAIGEEQPVRSCPGPVLSSSDVDDVEDIFRAFTHIDMYLE
ncbi:hypothetical protein OF83DRAFT_88787 [Amylostereum chailletii]|nr:hypothetical protein OF83DRAFT_88787 [Amylostereum chailletii]